MNARTELAPEGWGLGDVMPPGPGRGGACRRGDVMVWGGAPGAGLGAHGGASRARWRALRALCGTRRGGRVLTSKAGCAPSACCASVYPLLVCAGNDALRLEGRLLFRKLRPEWAASPARHSSSSRFALPKFAALAQILGFTDSGLERRGVFACLMPCLSRSGVHSYCELNLQKFCTRLNKIVFPGCKKQLRAVRL